MNLKKIFLYTLITSVAVSAVLGIGVILFGSFGELESRVLLTTFTIACTSILGLACGAYYESKQARNLPLAGILFSLVAAALCIYMIWIGDAGIEAIWKSAATTTLLATACGHLSLVSLATLDTRFNWSRQTIYLCVSILVVIVLYILWFEPDSSSDLVSRILGVLSIVIAALTVVTPVFHKLSHKETDAAQIDAEIATLRARIEELESKKREVA
jgi:hypothetical protein